MRWIWSSTWIILWNTLYIKAALVQLAAEGYPIQLGRCRAALAAGFRAHQSYWDALPSRFQTLWYGGSFDRFAILLTLLEDVA